MRVLPMGVFLLLVHGAASAADVPCTAEIRAYEAAPSDLARSVALVMCLQPQAQDKFKIPAGLNNPGATTEGLDYYSTDHPPS